MWRKSLVLVLVLAGSGLGEEKPPKEGTYYKYDQLGVRKTEEKNGRIELHFKPVDEQFYWCPGIKVQKTKVATVVTFVRCKTSKTCGVDVKASIGKRLARQVTIDSGGLDVYVRSGPKQFKKIYSSPNSKMNGQGGKKEGSSSSKTGSTKTGKSTSGNQRQGENRSASVGRGGFAGRARITPVMLWPVQRQGANRTVKNYQAEASRVE